MSNGEGLLMCNYKMCRKKLSGYAWVTACSHIFCDKHGTGKFSHFPSVCPACNNTLCGKLDIIRTELNPAEEYKAIVLAGLAPETVLDISSRALAFWTYQIDQESLFQEYAYSKAEARLKQMEKLYTQIQEKDMEMTVVKSEVNSLRKVLEEYKNKYSEISEKLMQRNRQYQKLQSLLDNLRICNIAVGEPEVMPDSSVMHQPSIFGLSAGSAPKIPKTDQTALRSRSAEGDFHLKPSLFGSPVAESGNSFFTFASPACSQEQHHMANRVSKVKKV
ncbi:E3 ubiquitin-protein ligase CCNB1IP1-like [Protopterus annectens]|uniref:E3 ubiquitin-protein ligase CCNB1IP1-like n=1 Tax=Protopterus annectens TaxID=7888 RepID=UPI001CF945C5|nr:E3 ubiquitin-protein ligase CCNB1IP1-like [Protopterus annectens]